MIYQIIKKIKNLNFSKPFHTTTKVYVGFIGALITIPVNILLVGLFKTIQPSRKEKKRLKRMGNITNKGLTEGDQISESSQSSSDSDSDDAEVNRKKGPKKKQEEIEMEALHHQSQETVLISGNQ